MQALLTQICEGLGIQASDLSIEEQPGEGELNVTVTLPLSGVQALDGREHRTAKAIRLLLSAAGAAKGSRINVVARAKE